MGGAWWSRRPMMSRGHFSNAGRSPPFPPSAVDVDVGVRVRGAFPPNTVLRCFPPRPPEGAGGPRARSVACSLTPSFLSHVPSGCPFPVWFFFVCVCVCFVVVCCVCLFSPGLSAFPYQSSGCLRPHPPPLSGQPARLMDTSTHSWQAVVSSRSLTVCGSQCHKAIPLTSWFLSYVSYP